MKIDKKKFDLAMARGGWDYDTLSAAAQLNRAIVYYTANKAAKLRPKTVHKIARTLGVDVANIVTFEATETGAAL